MNWRFFFFCLNHKNDYLYGCCNTRCICVSFPDITGQIKVRSDTTAILPCSTILPSDRDDWQRLYCVGVDPSTHNHRVIIDGPGSETVYNGHEFKTDLLYTRANQYISGKSKNYMSGHILQERSVRTIGRICIHLK